MTNGPTLESLYQVGKKWSGKGVIVECGTWLGASARAMLVGAKEAGYDRPFYCFDRWQANEEEAGKAHKAGWDSIKPNQDLEPMARENIEKVYPTVITGKGRIGAIPWGGGPIEIFVADGAKRGDAWLQMIDRYQPHWIDGATICLLDYYFYRKFDDHRREQYRDQENWVASEGDKMKPLPGLTAASAAFFTYRNG